jgi:predicted phage tail protein
MTFEEVDLVSGGTLSLGDSLVIAGVLGVVAGAALIVASPVIAAAVATVTVADVVGIGSSIGIAGGVVAGVGSVLQIVSAQGSGQMGDGTPININNPYVVKGDA